MTTVAPSIDARNARRSISLAHDRFITTGDDDGVRSVVASSWRRCLAAGLDPQDIAAPIDIVGDSLNDWRDTHPLAGVMPVIRKLLSDHAIEAGLLVAVGDATGRLLWTEGRTDVLKRAEQIHFVEGSCWSEDRAGTNAPGTALALDQPVHIIAAEHLSSSVAAWSCAAAPIHDPQSGEILGVLDLTGTEDVAAPSSIALIRATVTAVESELLTRRLLGQDPTPEPAARSSFRTLGMTGGVLHHPWATERLSLRHSELLVILSSYPEGIKGDRLATMLSEQDLAPVTLRAELSRLRSILGPISLLSRPYRLDGELDLDAHEVRSLLTRNELDTAIDLYKGPMLPTSDAPGVVEQRESLHARIRSAAMSSGNPSLILKLADTQFGRSDWELWASAESSLPHGSIREQAHAHLRYLDSQFALSGT